MAKLEIQTGEDNPVLRMKCAEIKSFDSKLKKLVRDMKVTMKKAGGLGLAAPQVGVPARLFLMIFDYKGKEERILAMVNPQIISHSDETELGEEGCLSLPKIYAKVERWRSVKVEFFDEGGVRQALELSGLDAREFQHENDHLDGVMFVDRVKERERGDGEVM